MNNTMRQIILNKEGHTYVFRFDDAGHSALLGVLARYAADAQLGFSWHDAAVVCKKARQGSDQGFLFAPSAAAAQRLR